MTSDLRRARRAFLLVGILIPVVLTAAGLAVLLNLLPLVPDPAATHWSPSGADGFAPAGVYVWMQLGLGLGIPVALSLTVLATTRDSWGITARFLGAIATWFSAFFAIAMAGSLWIQRGLTDAADAPSIVPVLGIALAIALLLGTGAWFLQPAVRVLPSISDGGASVRPISLRQGERVAWVGTATIARGGLIVLVFTLSLLVSITIVLLALGRGEWWITALVTVLVGFAMASSMAFRVRISAAGVHIRSLLGWPGVRLPLDRITDVEAVHIAPLAEFGGWGWRFGLDGRRGAVLRAGEALQVSTDGGRVYVATVDGAEDAVAVLRALRAREAGADAMTEAARDEQSGPNAEE